MTDKFVHNSKKDFNFASLVKIELDKTKNKCFELKHNALRGI